MEPDIHVLSPAVELAISTWADRVCQPIYNELNFESTVLPIVGTIITSALGGAWFLFKPSLPKARKF